MNNPIGCLLVKPAIIAVGGTLVSILLGWGASELERTQLEMHFHHDSDKINESVVRFVDLQVEKLYTIQYYYDASEQVTRSEFHRFVSPILASSPALHGLHWVPRVDHAERSDKEATARTDGVTGFQFLERSGEKMSRRQDSDVYFPIYYAEPMQDYTEVLGFDVGSNPESLNALQRASISGVITAAKATEIAGESGLLGVSLYWPVTSHSSSDNGPMLQGVILGVFDLGKLLNAALPSYRSGHGIYLFDVTTPSDLQLLASTDPRAESQKGNSADVFAEATSGLSHTRSFTVGGREWSLVVKADHQLVTEYRSNFPLVTMLGSLVLSILLAIWAFTSGLAATKLNRLNRSLEQRVFERTDELTEVNRQLSISETWHRTLIEGMTEGIIVIDDHANIRSFNRTAEAIFGFMADEVIGTNVNRLMLSTFRDQHDRFVERYRGDGRSSVMGADRDLRALRKSGEEFDLKVTINSMDIDGERVIVGLIRDVSVEREAARAAESRHRMELERSNKDLQNFAYVASHDLQEPLRMITSYMDLLAGRYKGKLDRDADRWISYVIDGSVRMKTLIRDLLSYSRITSQGKAAEAVDAGETLTQVLHDLHRLIEESGASVTYDELPKVMVDPGQFGRLMQNLIDNALKYSAPGRPPVIHIRCEKTDLFWEFCIKDNGIGIEGRFAERIFKVFQRLHGRDEYPGNGIGLAICCRIIERHGGRMWVESTLGEGSEFYFSLPIDPKSIPTGEQDIQVHAGSASIAK